MHRVGRGAAPRGPRSSLVVHLPRDAIVTSWLAQGADVVRHRSRGQLIEQLVLPFATRGCYVINLGGPALTACDHPRCCRAASSWKLQQGVRRMVPVDVHSVGSLSSRCYDDVGLQSW
jgi:hypothetical protein